jgi:hypothetical protein
MATRYKVPSQAASGADTWSDSLVGQQITDGSSQLTNTNFAVERVIPERDSKNFKTSPFSDYLTLDSLKEETNAPTTQYGNTKKEKIRFKDKLDDGSKSLFGSLKERLNVSVGRIISKFPAAFLVDEDSSYLITDYTAFNSTYTKSNNTTNFYVPETIIFNPFDIVLTKPNSNTIPSTDNTIRNLYSSYKKYVIDFSGNTYNVVYYKQADANGNVNFKVEGDIFSGTTGTTTSILVRPNDSVTEEFYNNLDELESILMNRFTNPKYTATFKVPRDSFDDTSVDIVDVTVEWPISKDNWNLQIVGINYDDYISQLTSLGDEIDNYKSNLIVRFLTSPQLFEFDTEEKRAESIFQLYGQSFDKVKKYIENIAYMRNVSYDGINNVPDILLKNLSETLGLTTVNLFNEKTLQETLYTRQQAEYLGLPIGKTLIEAEYEFYRRILTNLAHLYKSKGTRLAIEFFLKFLGAPEPLIKIDEYVYKVTSLPNSPDIEDDIDELIRGTKTQYEITGFTTSAITYNIIGGGQLTAFNLTGGTVTGSTKLTRLEYPIDGNGYPRKTTNLSNDIYFQKGSGWYDLTLNHRSSNIIDTELSVLTGNTKIIKTKPKPYTYGEDYFDNFRRLNGLDYGFELESMIDNKKSSVVTDTLESKLILNRKNINVFLSPSNGINYDVYRQSRNLELSFGLLQPQTGVTFAEYLNDTLKSIIPNSNSIKYNKSYFDLENIFNQYTSNTGFTPYNFVSVNEFITKMTPYWVEIVEQFVPSTTLWLGGNLIDSNVFNRSKYQYRLPRFGVYTVLSYNSTVFNCIGAIEPTPTPTQTPTKTPTPTVTATRTPTPTVTPTITPTSNTIAASPTPTNTVTPTPTNTVTPTTTPTPTTSFTPTPNTTSSSTPTPTLTPTPTDTPSGTPPAQLYTFYLAGGIPAAQSGTTYCATPGYVMTLTVQSTSSVVSLLLGSTILSGGNPYVGLGSDFIYAVSATQGDNTFVEGPTGFQYIKIDASGEVIDSGVLICSGGGGDDGGDDGGGETQPGGGIQ